LILPALPGIVTIVAFDWRKHVVVAMSKTWEYHWCRFLCFHRLRYHCCCRCRCHIFFIPKLQL